ncbi:MAG: hypothetical protein BIFFINMI_03888 [Phycisphaerae bacterium]|nr:hypothetical protein [Phycisphaerae bacterium]
MAEATVEGLRKEIAALETEAAQKREKLRVLLADTIKAKEAELNALYAEAGMPVGGKRTKGGGKGNASVAASVVAAIKAAGKDGATTLEIKKTVPDCGNVKTLLAKHAPDFAFKTTGAKRGMKFIAK